MDPAVDPAGADDDARRLQRLARDRLLDRVDGEDRGGQLALPFGDLQRVIKVGAVAGEAGEHVADIFHLLRRQGQYLHRGQIAGVGVHLVEAIRKIEGVHRAVEQGADEAHAGGPDVGTGAGVADVGEPAVAGNAYQVAGNPVHRIVGATGGSGDTIGRVGKSLPKGHEDSVGQVEDTELSAKVSDEYQRAGKDAGGAGY